MEAIDYTFTIEARDVPGMLVRMTQVFARRGCNIRSLNVRPIKHGQWCIIDIDAYDVERPDQIEKQLNKLIDVNSVFTKQHLLVNYKNVLQKETKNERLGETNLAGKSLRRSAVNAA